jgi:hypothetical protein
VTDKPTQVDSIKTTAMRQPKSLKMPKCVITPTPTGTNSKDKWFNKNSAQPATARRMLGNFSANSINTIPKTGQARLNQTVSQTTHPLPAAPATKQNPEAQGLRLKALQWQVLAAENL